MFFCTMTTYMQSVEYIRKLLMIIHITSITSENFTPHSMYHIRFQYNAFAIHGVSICFAYFCLCVYVVYVSDMCVKNV